MITKPLVTAGSFILAALTLLAAGCESGNNDPVADYRVDCSTTAAFTPPTTPHTVASATGSATTTVIFLHGKTGAPNLSHLVPFYTALSDAGYDVVAPYMPWSGTNWDGSMCEAIRYIDQLAATEAANGKQVVVAGHSMGGGHTLIYGVTEPSSNVKTLIALAPGHFPHQSKKMQEAIAASITDAEGKVAAGNGDAAATFNTFNNGAAVQISATANDYLSFHALDQYPDIDKVLPSITLPVLWVAGSEDTLTNTYSMSSRAQQITTAGSEYKLVSGDHLGMVANSAAPAISWLSARGL